MSELRTRDGRYLFADQGDGNAVVYDLHRPEDDRVCWDRWSYEVGRPGVPPGLPPVPQSPVVLDRPMGAGRVIRVTDDRDGELLNRTYSYWANAVVLGSRARVFVGHTDEQPRFFYVDLQTGAVERHGPMVSYRGTGEGWYFDAQGRVCLCDGPRFRRVHPESGEDQILFDISDTHPNCLLWQAHSSDDGQTHSATVKRIRSEGPYEAIGTLVFFHGEQQFFPAHGSLDESQVDRSGDYVVIKEDDDNRIITLRTRETRLLRDADGAVGHSDCGHGFMVGEDNIHGACVYWDLRQPLTPERRRELFHTWGMGVLSVRDDVCLVTDSTQISRVHLDGGGVTPLHPHGMIGSGYDFTCRASLSPCGRIASYVSNAAGRFDLYLLVL